MANRPFFIHLLLLFLFSCTQNGELPKSKHPKRTFNFHQLSFTLPYEHELDIQEWKKTPQMDYSLLFFCPLNKTTFGSLNSRLELSIKSGNSEQTFQSRFNYSPSGPKEELLSLFVDRQILKAFVNQSSDSQFSLRFSVSPASPLNCTFAWVQDNRFQEIPRPFFENFRFSKDQRKRLLFFGGSTMMDNGGPAPFPYIFQLFLESHFPGRYDVLNTASWGASLLDHIYNWSSIQTSPPLEHLPQGYPRFSNHFFKEYATYKPSREDLPYGFKDLAPDLVVISSMWNDFVMKLFQEGQTVPSFENSPLPLLYNQNLLDYTLDDRPYVRHSLLTLSQILNSWEKNGPLKTKKNWPFLGEVSLQQALYDYYYQMLRHFALQVRKDCPQVKLVFLTLPFGTNLTHGSWKKILQVNGTLNYNQYIQDPVKFMTFWTLVEKTQNSVAQRLAHEFTDSYLINLSSIYHEQFRKMSPKDISQHGPFLPDLMHFNGRGNPYIAEKLLEWFLEHRPL